MNKVKLFSISTYLAILFLLIAFVFAGCDGENNENVWVTLSKSSITLAVGQTETLEYTFTPEDAKDKSYVFSSNNTAVAKVAQDGTITALSTGTATITITTMRGGNSANCTVSVIAEPVTLSAPQNIRFDGEKVVWDRVPNRTGYMVELNGKELATVYATDFFRSFAEGIDNTVRVRTIGNGTAYLDSEWSEEFVFMQLEAPNLTASNGKIIFSSNASNPKYELYLDGALIKSNIVLGYDIIQTSSLSEGEHIYKAKALGDIEQNTYTSKFSSELIITKLYAPKNAIVSASTLSFDAVVGAQGYFMEMTEIATGNSSYASLSTNSYYLGDFYEAGKYNIKVMSNGDGVNTLDSEFSSEIALDKLDSPYNLTISNGIISWDYPIQARNGFLVNVYDTSSTAQATQIILSSNNFNFKEWCNNKKAGIYYVTVVATGDDSSSPIMRYINSAESDRLYITKLETPSNARISQNSLVWSSVSSSVSYQVWHNSTIFDTTEASFSFINTDDYSFPVGLNKAKVRAIGNNADILDSDYTEEIEFSKLSSLDSTSFSIINGTIVHWTSVPNCLRYALYINDDTPIEIADNKIDMSDVKYNALSYRIRVQALSSIDTYVMGELSAPFTFQKLGVSTNIGVVNGYLNWSAPSGSNIISSYRIKIGETIYDTNSSETKNTLHDFMADGTTQPISIQAICDDSTNQIMWGNFSEPILLTKLSSEFDSKIENGKYIWSQIENADKYTVIINYDFEGERFTENREISSTETRSLDLVSLSIFDKATTYYISIQAVASSGSQYISSRASNALGISRLKKVQNLRIENGVISWDFDENVYEYKAFITYLVDDIETTDIIRLDKATTLILGESYAPINYSIKVQACGNLSTTLDSILDDNSLELTKLKNNFEIVVDKNFVRWEAIENASSYSFELKNAENYVVNSNTALYNPQIDLTNTAWADKYYFILRANGDSERYVNGDWGANENEQYFIVKLLKTPTNLSIDNGILSWDYVNNTIDYEIKIISTNSLGEMVENIINYVKDDENERGQFNLVNYAISQSLKGQISVVIRAIGGVGIDAYVSSAYSDAITAYKLETPEFYTQSGIIRWNKINNVSNYKLYIDVGNKEILLPSANQYFELGKEFDSGEYRIKIQSIGDEKNYLSSDISSESIFEKLSMPTDVHLDKGQIVWGNIVNTDLYIINVYKLDTGGNFDFYVRQSLMAETQNSYLFSGDYGQYKITLQCIPRSNTKYLVSNVYEYSNILVKLSAPNDMHIENGILTWTPVSNLTENGYILDVGGNITSIGPVSSYALDGRSAIQYYVSITSVGDDIRYLTSDTSLPYSVYKIPQTTLLISEGQICWTTNTSTIDYELKIYNQENVVETIYIPKDNRFTLTYSLEGFDTGYYYAKIRSLAGDFSHDDIGACANSDWSEALYVFKLDSPQEFKLESDFESVDPDVLESLGILKWSEILNASKYTINIAVKEVYIDEQSQTVTYYHNYKTYENLTDTSLSFSDEALEGEGAYVISITAFNDESVVHDNIRYSMIKSDEVSLNTYKLPTARELFSQNGSLYWVDPDLGDDADIEFKYILYYKYADLDENWQAVDYDAKFVDGGIEHNVLYEGEQVLVRSIPMTQLGKYQFKLRTVGQNCIRSSLVECFNYYNYESSITSYCIFDLFYGGSGQELDPYIIKSFERNNVLRTACEQLDYINYFPTSSFRILEDITLNDTFISIGSKDELSSTFNGFIEGMSDDYEIFTIDMQNVVFNSSGNVGVGLFSSLGEHATVQYLNIKNVRIEGAYSTIGAIAPVNNGTLNNINVSNVVVGGASSSKDALYVGGLVGRNNGYIISCQATPILEPKSTMSYTYVGGITGYNTGTIEYCRTNQAFTYGEPVARQIIGTMVGGISGFNYGEAQIKECSNYANIHGQSSGDQLGGLAYGSAGGIVGRSSLSGGEISSLYPQIIDCYNCGKVSAIDETTLGASKAGGIIGKMDGGSIENCYNVGEIYVLNINGTTKEHSIAGGIIGYNDNNNSILTNSYFVASYSQGALPDSTTPLNGASSNYGKVEAIYLMETQLSDRYVLVENSYQILAWEAE